MILTQSAERTFRLCQRLFRYRHIDHLAWPEETPDQDDLYARLERGSEFHRLVDQTLKGRPVTVVREDVAVAYDRWKEVRFPEGAERWAEIDLSLPSVRTVGEAERTDVLHARLDLLVLDPTTQAVHIYDWKLGTAPDDPTKLRQDPQTVWYLYLTCALWPQLRRLVPAFSAVEDVADRLSMTYWYAQPLRGEARMHTIPYSHDQLLADRVLVEAAVHDMVDRSYEDYQLTANLTTCGRCQYRTLCHRPRGPLQRIEDDVAELLTWDLDLDEEAAEDGLIDAGR